MSCLYILEIKPCWVTLFASIFSQSIGCLFVLFMVSFVNNGIKITTVADMGASTECLLFTRHCSRTSRLSDVSSTPSAERELMGREGVKPQHSQAGGEDSGCLGPEGLSPRETCAFKSPKCLWPRGMSTGFGAQGSSSKQCRSSI